MLLKKLYPIPDSTELHLQLYLNPTLMFENIYF